MTDIDFDELDRAVNSLTANFATSGNQPAGEASSAQPQTPPTTPPPSPTPPVSPTTPSLAARRSPGRFMDVVRTTSTRPDSSTPTRVSRVGTTINGSNPAVSAPIEPQVSSTTEQPAPDTADDNQKPTAGDWPDPLDFHGFNTETPAAEPEEDEDIDKISADIENSLGQAGSDLPDSPFISDAKVEKRPLGAFSDEIPQPSTVEPEAAAADSPDSPTTPEVESAPAVAPTPPPALEQQYGATESEDVDTPLPAELQDDLLSIESNTVSQTSESTMLHDNDQPTGPTSIVQQYKEQPSTGEKDSGAIYDTNSYHKAFVKPPKKKSGWMWVMWITILLIVGAGAGAAVYYFVLPLL